jgi:acyl-CoA oxidase
MDDRLQSLLRDRLFDVRQRYHLPLRAYMDLTIERMHAIFNAGLVNNDMWLGQPGESHFRALCERIGVIGAYDYALYSSRVAHMIAANALLTLGSPDYPVEIEAQALAAQR